jgi:NADPH-dependent 7-cyano-7-deazaguanine reductase QueF
MSQVALDVPERRNLIVSHANTSLALDYVASFSGQIFHTIDVEVRYVPDKLVMDVNSLPDYLKALNSLANDALERLAGIILEDLNNELVPRWLHVTASVGDQSKPVRHSVSFEDRQPTWDNPVLLARLTSI